MASSRAIAAVRKLSGDGTSDIAPLVEIVAGLRPSRPDDAGAATRSVREFAARLRAEPDLALALSAYMGLLVSTRRQASLYSEVGILSGEGFFSELSRRLTSKVLPPAVDEHFFRDLVGVIFPRRTDWRWVAGVDDDAWGELFDLVRPTYTTPDARVRALRELLRALERLSHWIAAIGHDPVVLRLLPRLEQVESPFSAQSAEARGFIDSWERALEDPAATPDDGRHLEVLWDQCEEAIARIRRGTASTGINVGTTYKLQRLTEMIARSRLLLRPLDPAAAYETKLRTAATLFKTLVEADSKKDDVRDLVRKNTDLLALEVTSHAGRTGEHYITGNRQEWLQMLRAALGAGLVIGVMANIKVVMAGWHAPPLIEALFFSLNYAIGFVLIHILHFTIATKQPAMTAAKLAEAIDAAGDRRKQLDTVVELAVRVFRSQLVAIVGNVALAFPVAWAIAWLANHALGAAVAEPAKAAKLLHELDPVRSLAIPHAAIAGVWLFLAGLIAGYYDNLSIFGRVPERIRRARWIAVLAGKPGRERIAAYVEGNLGGLVGNFFFGFLLGTTALAGFLVGLPLDIRHIAFAAGNFGIALASNGGDTGLRIVVWSCVGIAAIGLANLTVSFALSLRLAFRARRVQPPAAGPILLALWQRLRARPGDFLFPSRQAPAEAEARTAGPGH
jgi:site-specific recombinase